METTILNPQVVYVQATTPSDLTEGKLWYNTITKEIYTSNGSSYVAMETDLSDLQKQNLEQDLNILINSVASSSTLNDWEEMFVDEFTDADGTSDTRNTGNTTALFSSSLYANGGVVNLTNPTEAGSTSPTYVTIKTFSGINGLVTDNITNEIKSGTSDTMFCRMKFIYDDESTEYSNEQTLTNTTSYTAKTYTNPSQAKIITQIEVQNHTTNQQSANKEQLTVIAINMTPENLIVETNAITCVTAQTHHQVFSHNTVAGSGAVTYDISFDNGSTWDTAQALNTKNARASTTGTQMILKLNLNGVGGDNTAQADDYGVMLFY